jgi:hypothetical protein
MGEFSVCRIWPPRYSMKGDVKSKGFSSELDGEIRLASSPTLHAFTKFVMGRVMFASPVTGVRFLLSLV